MAEILGSIALWLGAVASYSIQKWSGSEKRVPAAKLSKKNARVIAAPKNL